MGKKKGKRKAGDVVENDRDLYISGLPLDVTAEEVLEFVGKCGVVRKNAEAKPMVKIYRDEEGKPKGDATVYFYKKESVDLALTLLDETEIREGFKVKLGRAVYTVKEEKAPPRKKARGYDQAKELSWDDENKVRCAVIKGMFTLEEVCSEDRFVAELKEDVAEECGKCGEVTSVTVFEHNPEGVVVVKFKDPGAAERCVRVMDGRFFDGRVLRAELYDGYSDYYVAETEEAKQKRLAAWEKYLEEE